MASGGVIPVRVAIRIRPLSGKERQEGCENALRVVEGRQQVKDTNSLYDDQPSTLMTTVHKMKLKRSHYHASRFALFPATHGIYFPESKVFRWILKFWKEMSLTFQEKWKSRLSFGPYLTNFTNLSDGFLDFMVNYLSHHVINFLKFFEFWHDFPSVLILLSFFSQSAKRQAWATFNWQFEPFGTCSDQFFACSRLHYSIATRRSPMTLPLTCLLHKGQFSTMLWIHWSPTSLKVRTVCNWAELCLFGRRHECSVFPPLKKATTWQFWHTARLDLERRTRWERLVRPSRQPPTRKRESLPEPWTKFSPKLTTSKFTTSSRWVEFTPIHAFFHICDMFTYNTYILWHF